MNAAIPNAMPATTGATPGAASGLFGALSGAQGSGALAGFEALLAAFFGQQGQEVAPAAAGKGSIGGKAALTLVSDNKAGHPTMDDALNLSPEPGQNPKDSALDDAPLVDAAPTPNGISPDAQALAALFAQPLAKPDPVVETTAAPPPEVSAPRAAPGFDAGQARALAVAEAAAQKTALDLTSDVAESADAKTDAAPEPLSGKAKLVEMAQALAAGRNGSPAPKPIDAQPQTYAPPPAPPAQAVQAPPAALTVAEPAPAVTAEVAEAELPAAVPAAPRDRASRGRHPDAIHKDGPQWLLSGATGDVTNAAGKPINPIALAATAKPLPDATDTPPTEIETEIPVAAADGADARAQGPALPLPVEASPVSAHATTAAVRGAPETVASLAAQIIKKAEGNATRFDLQLHPADLGRVDVRLEIGAHGRLTASMSFENPHAAAELRGRADELQRALESAGFDISGGLNFDVAGDRGQKQNEAQQQTAENGGGVRGRAFEAALATAGETANAALAGALSAYQRRVAPGVDIRI